MKLFGKNKELSPTEQVRGIMQYFIEASYIGLGNSRFQTVEHGLMCLTYMFGSVDMLCQANQIDSAKTIAIFQGLLEDLLGGYAPDDAKQIMREVLRASCNPDGQRIMREGAESVRSWICGETLAAHRLEELLSEIGA